MTSRIRKKRPLEKNLPKSLQLLPESHLYTKLQMLEKQIDTVLVRKRLDVQEALSKSVRQARTFRLQVSNLFDGESWTLQVEGRLLPSTATTAAGATGNNSGGNGGGSFSTFFKGALVELGSGESVEWLRSQNECDGFEVKRAGRDPVECKIYLQMDSMPEKFKLSPRLAQLLNVHAETKSACIMACWQYIKVEKLQDGTDFRVIHCNEQLKEIFGCQEFQFSQLPELLAPHMSRTDPIVIQYQVRTDCEHFRLPYVIDCEVDVEDPIRATMMKFILNTGGQKEYAQLDTQIQKLIQQIHVHKVKKDFMSSFARNPVDFLEKWIGAQSRDLEVVLGENQVNAEWQRRSVFYNEQWVPEAVLHYLSQSQHLQPLQQQ